MKQKKVQLLFLSCLQLADIKKLSINMAMFIAVWSFLFFYANLFKLNAQEKQSFNNREKPFAVTNMIWDCHREDKNTNWDNPQQEGLPSACKWDSKVEKGGVDMSGNSGQQVQEDVYVWKVKLTDVFEKKHLYIGHVSVVK
jgi:hypothetical protein